MFDINDPFYQDICTPYTTINNTDIPLSDREEYIYNDKDKKCPDNCHFSSYILNSIYINCTCDIEPIKEKIVKTFKRKKLYESFYDVLKYANFKILKCYNLIFNINIFNNNIGNFIVISFFSMYLICLIVFIAKGINPLITKIKNFISSKEDIDDKNIIFTQSNIFQKKNRNKKISHLKTKKTSKNYKKSKDKKFKTKKDKKENSLNKHLYSKKNSSDILSKENRIGFLISKRRKSKLDEFELNELEYEEAIIHDKSSFIKIYWDKICREHIVIFTFFICNDYNILYIKYSRFIFLFVTDMAINVFFFSDDSMHKIFLNYGKYNFIQQVPQIIYTTIISQLIEIFLCYLSLTNKHIYQIKKMIHNIHKNEIAKILKCIKEKFVVFYIFTFIFFVFYWYTVTSFCSVYENTQITFIKDSLLSFLLGILYPFIIYLIPSALRIIALRNEKKCLKCIYKLSEIIPFF